MNKSYFAVIFDKNGALDYYSETKIVGNDIEYTADVAVYSNGILLNEEHLQLEQKDFEVVAPKDVSKENHFFSFLKPQTASAGFWSDFNDCLASQGIAGWAITALSVACGFACIGTAGAGCVPCLLGAGLLTEGVVAYCVYSSR